MSACDHEARARQLLSEFQESCDDVPVELEGCTWATRYFDELFELLKWFVRKNPEHGWDSNDAYAAASIGTDEAVFGGFTIEDR